MLVVYISRCSPAPAAAAYPMQRYGKLGETQNKWAHFFRLPRRRPATRPKPTPLCRAAARGPGRPADGPGGWAQAGRAMHACLRGWRRRLRFCVKQNDSTGPSAQQSECIIRKSKFSPNPKRSVHFSSVHSKRSVQKGLARNTNNKARNKSQNSSIPGFVKSYLTGNITTFK